MSGKPELAGQTDKELHAALDVNIPSYASATATTREVVEAIAALQISGISVR